MAAVQKRAYTCMHAHIHICDIAISVMKTIIFISILLKKSNDNLFSSNISVCLHIPLA